MTRLARFATVIGLSALCVSTPSAVPPSSDVMGQVQDAQGTPVVGASLTFTNSTDPKITYSVATDKKGRFSYSGLLYIQPGMWKVAVKAEGLVPSKIHVDSKTSSAVVANVNSAMRVDGTPYEFPLKAFGTARLEIVMIPADQVPVTAGASPGSGTATVVDDPITQATARTRAGDLEGAVPFYKKALEKNPDDGTIHLEYAKVLLQLKNYSESATEASRAAELIPDKPGPHRTLASIYAAQEQFGQAYSEIQKARELSPSDPAVLAATAQLAELSGQSAEAIQGYEALVAMQPDNAQAWVALGGLYSRAGQADKSEAALRKVTELDPANAYQTFFKIGAALVNKSDSSPADMRKAIEAFRKSVELKPTFGPSNTQLAYALIHVGEIDQARAVIENFVKLDASSPDAKELQSLVSGLPPSKKK